MNARSLSKNRSLLALCAALVLGGCVDDLPFAPATDTAPRFLIGNSPLAPFRVWKAPVLDAKQDASGQVTRQLVVELYMDRARLDALKKGRTGYESGSAFSLNGALVALADPRPSPVIGILGGDDDEARVVIAQPIDDATWAKIAAAAKPGQRVDVAMQIDLVDYANGGAVIHGVSAEGSFDPASGAGK